MLNENIKTIRKSKGLSQEELAIKLNVVLQTISKWEQGLSVPDSDMLISISEALDTPVSTLLGETVNEPKADDLKAISEKLDDRERTVITLRYGLNGGRCYTQREVAERLGISRSYVSRIEKVALEKIREAL